MNDIFMPDGVTIQNLITASYTNSREHGFWTGPDNTNIPTKLMLIVSEVAEAMEGYRKGDIANFAEEIADVFIRLGDLSGRIQEDFPGIDIEDAIVKKTIKNRARPYMHGGKRF